MSSSWFEETPQGILLRIQVQPKASRTECVGLHGDPPRLKIRVAAPPVEGAANDELHHFLKKRLGVPLSQIQLLRGIASKHKDFLCQGVPRERVETLAKPGKKPI